MQIVKFAMRVVKVTNNFCNISSTTELWKIIPKNKMASESVKFSLIESVICLCTDSSVKKYFSLLNQLTLLIHQ